MDHAHAKDSLDNLSSRRPGKLYRLALMWRGNWRAPEEPTNHASRLAPLVQAFAVLGVETTPVLYFDEEVEAARRAVLLCDGVMVWINPLQDGRDRAKVNALLRDVANEGVLVSAHPDAIGSMGTKEVLFQTRDLGWGVDVDIYRTHEEFALRFPVKLATAGARVLKPLRGNDGQGVTKVELAGPGQVRVQSASSDLLETLPFADLLPRLAGAFADGGLIDQAFQTNVEAGMVRCYMSGDRVVGFSEQQPRARETRSGAPAFGMHSAKAMHDADAARFLDLRRLMEVDWTPSLMRTLGLAPDDLPALWDADFLWREAGAARPSPWALCEINVSSVLPFPDMSAPLIARTVCDRLARRRPAASGYAEQRVRKPHS
jgi:hypothetical protein